MPKFEIEINDTGDLVGDAPAELDTLFKRIETTAHGSGFTKATEKAAAEAKAQIEAAVIAERRRMEQMAPVQAAEYEREKGENKTLKTQLLELSRSHGDTLKSQEERHAAALIERTDALKKRNDRIVALTKKSIIAEAIRHGARDESLSELEVILHSSIGYSDDMEPFVHTGDGRTPKTVQGKPQDLGAFVKEYLDGHSHHKRAPAHQGGGARGGATFGGHRGAASADAAKARIQEQGDRSSDAINDLFEATRRKSA